MPLVLLNQKSKANPFAFELRIGRMSGETWSCCLFMICCPLFPFANILPPHSPVYWNTTSLIGISLTQGPIEYSMTMKIYQPGKLISSEMTSLDLINLLNVMHFKQWFSIPWKVVQLWNSCNFTFFFVLVEYCTPLQSWALFRTLSITCIYMKTNISSPPISK